METGDILTIRIAVVLSKADKHVTPLIEELKACKQFLIDRRKNKTSMMFEVPAQLLSRLEPKLMRVKTDSVRLQLLSRSDKYYVHAMAKLGDNVDARTKRDVLIASLKRLIAKGERPDVIVDNCEVASEGYDKLLRIARGLENY